jgi:hypothetical protein
VKTAWRIHRRPEVTAYLVSLREAGTAIRAAVASLQNGVPPDATETEPDTYIWFEAEHWLGFVVDQAEHAIYVSVVEQS